MDSWRFAIILILLTVLPISSAATSKLEFDHSHGLWTKVLTDFSINSMVDYKGLKDASEDFDLYLKGLASVSKKGEKSWPREKRLAFWINAYNAFTVKAILDNYPPKASNFIKRKMYGEYSIRHIKDVWEKDIYRAAGQKVSLSHIEHKILREELNEPRIHFAIVCASIGCPLLRGQAYTAKELENQFEDSVKVFLGRKENFKLSLVDGKLMLSPIIKWFYKDFERFDDKTMARYESKARGGLAFLAKRLPPDSARAIRDRKLSFKWISYDWSLNSR